MTTWEHDGALYLWPYVRGAYPRHTLYELWCLMEQSQGAPAIFYGQVCPDEAWRGDLVQFVRYFEPEVGLPRQLVFLEDRTTTRILGYLWFDVIQPGYSVSIGVFYARPTPTPTRLRGTRLALAYAFEVLDVTMIQAFTPWKNALWHAKQVGMTHVATLPRFVCVQDRARDVYVAVKEK